MSSGAKRNRKNAEAVTKERESSGFRIRNIFGTPSAGAMVPVAPPKASSQGERVQAQEKKSARSNHPAESTRVHPTTVHGSRQKALASDLTSTVLTPPTKPAPRAPEPQSEKEDRKPILLLALAVTAIAMVAAFQQGARFGEGGFSFISGSQPNKSYDLKRFNENAEYHKIATGAKLNRERVKQAYENERTAPALSGVEQAAPRDASFDGVPLAPEGFHRRSSRDQTQYMNTDHPDNRIMAGLQEEQDMREWEKRADQEYIKDFVKNAEAAGYRVKLDKNLNVIRIDRLPSADPSYTVPGNVYQGSRSGGGMAE